jgi:hypothetical protein
MRSPIEFNYDGPRPSIPRGIRIGSVPYLNAVPLTWGLEREIVFLPPSQLGLAIREGELDVALLSITQSTAWVSAPEVLFEVCFWLTQTLLKRSKTFTVIQPP